jgi:hypothetical protein
VNFIRKDEVAGIEVAEDAVFHEDLDAFFSISVVNISDNAAPRVVKTVVVEAQSHAITNLHGKISM